MVILENFGMYLNLIAFFMLGLFRRSKSSGLLVIIFSYHTQLLLLRIIIIYQKMK